MSLPDKIWNTLKSKGMLTAGEIAREIQAPRNSVNTILGRLKGKQQVMSLAGHKWGLPTKEYMTEMEANI